MEGISRSLDTDRAERKVQRKRAFYRDSLQLAITQIGEK
jgi:hypothetical protein